MAAQGRHPHFDLELLLCDPSDFDRLGVDLALPSPAEGQKGYGLTPTLWRGLGPSRR